MIWKTVPVTTVLTISVELTISRLQNKVLRTLEIRHYGPVCDVSGTGP